MRWVRLVILSIGAGLIATTLVALACALWSPVRPSGQWFSSGKVPPWVTFTVPRGWLAPLGPGRQVWMEYVESRGMGLLHGEFGCDESIIGPAIPFPHTLAYRRAGWPVAALECVITSEGDLPSTAVWPGAVRAPDWMRPRPFFSYQVAATNDRYLPLNPIPTGMLTDTAFYGALAALLMLGPGGTLRLLRRRAGRCVWCGYNRQGLPDVAKCPECGRADGA